MNMVGEGGGGGGSLLGPVGSLLRKFSNDHLKIAFKKRSWP